MTLDNKTVLENLTKQREDIMKQIDTARTTLLKLDGAIDVLTQIEEANEVKETEVVVPENE